MMNGYLIEFDDAHTSEVRTTMYIYQSRAEAWRMKLEIIKNGSAIISGKIVPVSNPRIVEYT